MLILPIKLHHNPLTFNLQKAMAILRRNVSKEITFFSYDFIDSDTLQSLIDFCDLQQDVLLDSIRITFSKRKVNMIEIGGVVKSHVLEPTVFYYFKHGQLLSTLATDNVNLW